MACSECGRKPLSSSGAPFSGGYPIRLAYRSMAVCHISQTYSQCSPPPPGTRELTYPGGCSLSSRAVCRLAPGDLSRSFMIPVRVKTVDSTSLSSHQSVRLQVRAGTSGNDEHDAMCKAVCLGSDREFPVDLDHDPNRLFDWSWLDCISTTSPHRRGDD